MAVDKSSLYILDLRNLASLGGWDKIGIRGEYTRCEGFDAKLFATLSTVSS